MTLKPDRSPGKRSAHRVGNFGYCAFRLLSGKSALAARCKGQISCKKRPGGRYIAAPEYIIEPFMETTVMVEDQSLPGHVEALATLRKAYEERKGLLAYGRHFGCIESSVGCNKQKC